MDFLQRLSAAMTCPTFDSIPTLVAGWAFARCRMVTGTIVAAGAAGGKHRSAYHRVVAAARWALDELGLATFGLVAPLLGDGTVLVAVDD